MKVVSILDYGMGNLKSVQNALEFFKIRYLITNEKNKIDDSDLLILPGVGSFKQAMINIKSLGLDDIIKENVIKLEKPILGICLGMQLFADEGEEDGIYSTPSDIKKKKESAQKRKLVRRSHLMTIITAWLVTVPAAALLSGLIYLLLNALF